MVYGHPFQAMGILIIRTFFFNPYENGVIIPTQGLGIQSN